MTVGSQEETVDFDAKHLAKRLRNQLLSTMFTVNEVALTRTDLSTNLSLAAEDSKHRIEQLTNPDDRQNISLATDLLLTFAKAVKLPTLSSVGIRVVSVAPALALLGLIVEGVLALYAYVTASIKEQLVYMSKAAHSLLTQYRVFVL